MALRQRSLHAVLGISRKRIVRFALLAAIAAAVRRWSARRQASDADDWPRR